MKRGIKHGQMPGDISKGYKIMLLEGKIKDERARGRGLRRDILKKERAVLKRRFQRELATEE